MKVHESFSVLHLTTDEKSYSLFIKVETSSIACDAIAIKLALREQPVLLKFLYEIHRYLITLITCAAHLEGRIPRFTWGGTGQWLWHCKPGLEYTLDGN